MDYEKTPLVEENGEINVQAMSDDIGINCEINETRRLDSDDIGMQCSRQQHISCATGKLNNIIDKTLENGRDKTTKMQFGPLRSKQENKVFSDDDDDL